MRKILRNTIAVLSSALLILNCSPAMSGFSSSSDYIFEDPIPMASSDDLVSTGGDPATAWISKEIDKIQNAAPDKCKEFDGTYKIRLHFQDRDGNDQTRTISYGLSSAEKTLDITDDTVHGAYKLDFSNLGIDQDVARQIMFWTTKDGLFPGSDDEYADSEGQERDQRDSDDPENSDALTLRDVNEGAFRIVPATSVVDHLVYDFDMSYAFDDDGNLISNAEDLDRAIQAYSAVSEDQADGFGFGEGLSELAAISDPAVERNPVMCSLEPCATEDRVIDLYAVKGKPVEEDLLDGDIESAFEGDDANAQADESQDATVPSDDAGFAIDSTWEASDGDNDADDGSDATDGNDVNGNSNGNDAAANDQAANANASADSENADREATEGEDTGQELSPEDLSASKDEQFKSFILNTTMGTSAVVSNPWADIAPIVQRNGSTSPIAIFSAAWYTQDQQVDDDVKNLSLYAGTSTSTLIDVSFGVQLQLNAPANFKAGAVSITIPKSVFVDHSGKPLGTITLPKTIGTYPASTDWTYTQYADKYVITSNRMLSSSVLFGFDVKVSGVSPSSVQDITAGKAGTFTLIANATSADGSTGTAESATLTTTVDHFSEVYNATGSTSYPTLSKSAPSGVTALSGDWVYATYYAQASVRGPQPATLTCTIDPAISMANRSEAYQPQMLGYKLNGKYTASSSKTVTIYENTITNSTTAGTIYFYVAYPRAWWDDYGSGETHTAAVKGTIKYDLVDAEDSLHTTASVTETNSLNYVVVTTTKPTTPTTPTTPPTSTKTDTQYTAHSAYKAAGRTYSTLDSIASGSSQALYWTMDDVVYLAPFTRPNASDPTEKATATVTITDGDICSQNTVASGIGLTSLELTMPDGKDYRPVTSEGYATTMTAKQDAGYRRYHWVQAGEYAYYSLPKTEVTADYQVQFYRSGSGWSTAGTVSYSNGNVSTTIPGATLSGTKLTIPTDFAVSGWKVIITTDMAGVTFYATPNYKVDGSYDAVAKKAAGLLGSKWSIINKFTATAASSANSKTSSSSDYHYNYLTSNYSTASAMSHSHSAVSTSYTASGLDKLYMGTDITLSYTTSASHRWAKFSHDEETKQNAPITYRLSSPNMRFDDMLSAEGITLSSMTISKPTWYDYVPQASTGYQTRAHRTDYTKTEYSYGVAGSYYYATAATQPDINIYVNRGGTWELYDTYRWVGTKVQSDNGHVTASSSTLAAVSFAGVDDAIEWRVEATTALAGVSGLTIKPTYTLHSASATLGDTLRSKMDSSLSEVLVKFTNTSKLEIVKNGETKHTTSYAASHTLKASSFAANAVLSTSMYYQDTTNTMRLSYSAYAAIGSNSTKDNWEALRTNGVTSTLEHGTYYILLPFGAVYDEAYSISPTGYSKVESIKTIRDYNETGQTLLIVEVSHTPQSVASLGSSYGLKSFTGYGDRTGITFTASMSLADYSANGRSATSVMAYCDSPENTGRISNQGGYISETQDSNFNNHVNSAQAVQGIENLFLPETLTGVEGARAIYARSVATNYQLMEYTTMYSKDIAVNGSVSYSDGTSAAKNAYEGGLYTYRTSIQHGANGSATLEDVVLYDNLERDTNFAEYDDNAADTRWRGTFVSIDTYRLKRAKVNCTVYYSTVEGLDFTHGADLIPTVDDESVWSTEMPEDKSTITAVAVDCSKNEDGSKQLIKLTDGTDLSILIQMRAPFALDLAEGTESPKSAFYDTSSEAEAGLTGGAHAYNWSAMTFNVASGSFLDSENYLVSAYTKVGICQFDLKVNAYWIDANNNDGFRPSELLVHLYDGDGDTGEVLVLNDENDWKGEFEHVSRVNEEGSIRNFTFVPEGSDIYNEKYTNTSYTQIFSTGRTYNLTSYHSIEQVEVAGVKEWVDDEPENRPASVKFILYQNGEVKKGYEREATAAGGWAYSFGNLAKYSNGNENTYRVEEDGYVKGYQTQNPMTPGDYNVVNTYRPTCSFTIRHTYRNDTAEAATKLMTYTITAKERYPSTEIIEAEFTVKIKNEDGTVADTLYLSSGESFEMGKTQYADVTNAPSDTDIYVAQATPPGFTASRSTAAINLRSLGRSSAEFVDTYSSKTEIYMSAFKEIAGQELAANSFVFQIKDGDGNLVREAGNTISGGVDFNPIYVDNFMDGRSMTYFISEKNEEKPGYTYDTHEEVVHVLIHDNGDGTIDTNLTYDGDRKFSNVYEGSGTVVINAYVKTTGLGEVLRALGATDDDFLNNASPSGWFTYALYDSTGTRVYVKDDGSTCKQGDAGAKELVGTNNADGIVSFPPIKFSQDKTDQTLTYYVVPLGVDKAAINADAPKIGVDMSLDISDVTSADLGAYIDRHIVLDPQVVRQDVSITDNYDSTLRCIATPVYSGSVTVGGKSKTAKSSIQFVNTFNSGNLSIAKTIEAADSSVADTLFKFKVQLGTPTGEAVEIKAQTKNQADSIQQAPLQAAMASNISSVTNKSVTAISSARESGGDAKDTFGKGFVPAASDLLLVTPVDLPDFAVSAYQAEGDVLASGIVLDKYNDYRWVVTQGKYYNDPKLSILPNGQITALMCAYATLTTPESFSSSDLRKKGMSNIAPWGSYHSSITTISFAKGTRLTSTRIDAKDPSSGRNFDESFTPAQEHMNVLSDDYTNIQCDYDNTTNQDFVTLFNFMFNLQTANFDDLDTSQMKNAPLLLKGCKLLADKSIEKIDTSNLHDISGFFMGTAYSSLDLTRWDVRNVTDAYYLFYGCKSLTSLNLSGLDFQNLEEVAGGNLDFTNNDTSNGMAFDDNGDPYPTMEMPEEAHWFGRRGELSIYWWEALKASADVGSHFPTLDYDSYSWSTEYKYLTPHNLSLEDYETSNPDGGMMGPSNYNTFIQNGPCANLQGWLHNSALTTNSSATINVTMTKFSGLRSADLMFAKFAGSAITGLNTCQFGSSSYREGVKSFRGMFMSCPRITELNLTRLNNADAQAMAYMFYDCAKLKTIYVSDLWATDPDNLKWELYNAAPLGDPQDSVWSSDGYRGYAMFGKCYSLQGKALSYEEVWNDEWMYWDTEEKEVPTYYNAMANCTTSPTYDLPYSSFSSYSYWDSYYRSGADMATYYVSGAWSNPEVLDGTANSSKKGGILLTYKEQSPDLYKVTLYDEGKIYSVSLVSYGNFFTFPKYDNAKDATKVEQFHCWRTGATSGTEYTASKSYKVTGDVSFYAHFQVSAMTIAYNANGGVGTMPNSVYAKADATKMVLPANQFVRPGYLFTNWAKKDANGNFVSVGVPGEKLPSTSFVENTTLTLYAQWKNENEVSMSGDNVLEFMQRGGQVTTLSDLPAGTSYSVYEETQNGWNLIASSVTNGTIMPDATARASFTNKYAPESAQVIFRATMDISGYQLDRSGYAFDLFEVASNGTTSYLQTAYSLSSGAIEFAPIEYSTTGTRNYRIVENPAKSPQHDSLNMVYDDHAETLSVVVTNANASVMEAEVTYNSGEAKFTNTVPPTELNILSYVHGTEDATKGFDYVVEILGQDPTTVNLTHSSQHQIADIPHGTSYVIEQVSVPAGYSFSHAEAKTINEIAATVTEIASADASIGVAGGAMRIAANEASGAGASMSANASSAASASAISGASASASSAPIASNTGSGNGASPSGMIGGASLLSGEKQLSFTGTSELSRAIDGDAIVVEANRLAGRASNLDTDVIAFHNNYSTGGTVTFSATKALVGDTLAEDQFTFELWRDGNKVATVKNAEDGTIKFDTLDVGLDDDGATYEIREVINASDKRISYDESVKDATISVADNQDGTCTTNIEYASGNEFVNTVLSGTYDVTVATEGYMPPTISTQEFPIKVTIVLKDGTESTDDITYSLTDAGIEMDESADRTVAPAGSDIPIKVGQTLRIYVPDGATIKVEEVVPPGYEVRGSEDEENPGAAEQKITGGEGYSVEFTNTYSAAGPYFPTAQLAVEGSQMRYGQFHFVLVDDEGLEFDTSFNTETGQIFFSGMDFTHEDVGYTRTFTMHQINDEQRGYTYDEKIVDVAMEVTDNGDGTLSFNALYSNIPEIPVFINSYAIFLPNTGNPGLVGLAIVGWAFVIISVIYDHRRRKYLELDAAAEAAAAANGAGGGSGDKAAGEADAKQ